MIGFYWKLFTSDPPLNEGLQLCEKTMQYLHSCSVVYRDLNKGNIMINNSVVKVLDYEAAQFQTKTNFIILMSQEAQLLEKKGLEI